ncbi:28S ribosomal protein S11, mitochondrial [Astyanax mexicanus]|uniref:Small ribosomal subunit protein uS11m n=2 Tax=Astyanax mexicanus TaxID=7994 RepID=A0A8B9HA32_ASTMX|nr:28S ribosomal protein S11, mitochondrial [Astyanax mexicanus]KAG9266976.1 28S ribosomal protein S11, mitochondrial [Astyanax mexicanus]
MYKLNSALSCLLRGTNQQILEPLTAASRTLGGNFVGLRPLSRTAARLQEAETQTEVEVTPETVKSRSKDFSHYPPLPGQDSALRWDGKKFEDLHIIHVKATYNNTHIQVTDNLGQSMVRTSCGTEGFRNSKKSTPIAAQTAGISAASKAQAKGVTFARVLVKGLGPGRLSAIKGLSMGGLQIVSITDNTPVPHNGCRPRKARRM